MTPFWDHIHILYGQTVAVVYIIACGAAKRFAQVATEDHETKWYSTFRQTIELYVEYVECITLLWLVCVLQTIKVLTTSSFANRSVTEFTFLTSLWTIIQLFCWTFLFFFSNRSRISLYNRYLIQYTIHVCVIYLKDRYVGSWLHITE